MDENVIEINGGITINVGVSVKNITHVKNIFGILLRVVVKMVNILASIIDNSVITFDEIIEEETKIVTTNFNEKNAICQTKNFCILLVFLLIRIAILVAVSIYYYFMKYKAHQKHLLPFCITNNELKEVL